jgi:hypothetical protein
LKEGNKVKDGTAAFEVEHMEHFTRMNFNFPPCPQDYIDVGLPGLQKKLPRRSAEVVYYFTKRGVGPAEWVKEEVVDLAKSLPWSLQQTKRAVVPCLASSSRPWLLRSWGHEVRAGPQQDSWVQPTILFSGRVLAVPGLVMFRNCR